MYAPQVIVEVLKNGKKQMRLIKNREKLSMHPNITAVTVHPTYLKKLRQVFPLCMPERSVWKGL